MLGNQIAPSRLLNSASVLSLATVTIRPVFVYVQPTSRCTGERNRIGEGFSSYTFNNPGWKGIRTPLRTLHATLYEENVDLFPFLRPVQLHQRRARMREGQISIECILSRDLPLNTHETDCRAHYVCQALTCKA